MTAREGRPFPDPELRQRGGYTWADEELGEWVRTTFLEEGGALANPDHEHLLDADVAFAWTTSDWNRAGGNAVIGLAELGTYLPGRTGGWVKDRTAQALGGLLGRSGGRSLPDFLVTLSAGFATFASHAAFCALVEHELYHCAHATDQYGMPKWTRDGGRVWGIRRHDVEEFVGVVARYGAEASGPGVAELVAAANAGPTIEAAKIGRGCGVCLLR